jgi:hypothetical protein
MLINSAVASECSKIGTSQNVNNANAGLPRFTEDTNFKNATYLVDALK